MKREVWSRESGIRIAVLTILAASVCLAALNPVEWTLTSDVQKVAPGATIPLRLTAKIDEGWHIYSVTTPPPTIPVSIKLGDAPAHVFQPKPVSDELLGVKA